MAEACGFDESDAVLGPPPGMSAEECQALQILRISDGTHPIVVSCWKLTKDELDEINRTGRVWLMIWGETMPPAAVSGTKPFSVEPPA